MIWRGMLLNYRFFFIRVTRRRRRRTRGGDAHIGTDTAVDTGGGGAGARNKNGPPPPPQLSDLELLLMVHSVGACFREDEKMMPMNHSTRSFSFRQSGLMRKMG